MISKSEMTFFWSLLLFFFLLPSFTLSRDKVTEAGHPTTLNCTTDEGCFLHSLKLSHPAQITRRHGLLLVSVQNFTCSSLSLSLSSINSSLYDPLGSGIQIDLDDVGLRCTLDWSYNVKFSPLGDSGPATIEFYGSKLSLGIHFTEGEYGETNGSYLSPCKTLLNTSYLYFTSSATTKNLAEGLQEVLNATAQDILREAFCGKDGELTTIVNTTLNNTLSSFSTFITPFLIPPPPLSPSLPPPHVLNLSSPVFEIVPFLVNDFLGTTGPLNINNFINYLTGDGSVELGGLLSLTPFSSPFLSLSFLDGVFGVDLDLARLVVSDLDQVSDLEMLIPSSSTVLESTAIWRDIMIDISANFSIQVLDVTNKTFPPLLESEDGWGEEEEWEEERREREGEGEGWERKELSGVDFPFSLYSLGGGMGVNVSDFMVSSTEQVFINSSLALATLQEPQVILIHVPCVVQPIEELSALSLNASGLIEEVIFEIEADRVTDLDVLFANFLTLFSYALGPTFMGTLNTISMTTVLPLLNEEFTKLVTWAQGLECVFTVVGVFNYKASMVGFVVCLSLAFILQIFMAHETFVKNKKTRLGWFELNSSELDSDEMAQIQSKGEAYGSLEEKKEDEVSKAKEIHCGSVHSDLPYVIRSFVPVMGLVLIGLMVSYLSGVGASVFIDLILGWRDDVIEIPPVFQFDFPSVLNVLRQAKVYTTAIILAMGGGLFPVLIDLVFFLFWLVPVHYISVKSRILWTQVAMSSIKYYPITGYLLVILAVGFRLNLVPDFPDRPGMQGTGMSMYVAGSYAYFCCLASMVLVAFLCLLVYYCLLNYSKTHYMNRYRYVCPSKRLVFSVMILSTVGLICFFIGGPLPFFRLTFDGLPAKAIHQPRVFTLWSLPSALADSGGLRTSEINLGTVIFAVVCMSCVFPVLHLVSILLMSVVCASTLAGVKVKPKVVSYCLGAVEVWNMFAGLEVMVLLYLGTVPFVSQFAKYIIGTRCGPINTVLEIPVISDWLNGDPVCFGLKGELLIGTYFLTICVICARVAHFLCHYLWKRYDQVEEGVSWTGGNGSGY